MAFRHHPRAHRLRQLVRSSKLTVLYENRDAIGNFVTVGGDLRAYYWSSTEAGEIAAYPRDFAGGGESNGLKSYMHSVRCARRD